MIRTVPNIDAERRRSLSRTLLLLALLASSGPLSAQTSDTTTIQILGGCWVDEGAERFTLIPILRKAVSSPVSIRLHFDGSATRDDHSHVDTTVVIPQGMKSVTIQAPMIDDDHVEPVETVEIHAIVLEGPAKMFDSAPTVIYLLDNDAPVNLLVNPGFENGGAAWSFEELGEGVSVSSDFSPEGLASLKLTASKLRGRGAFQDAEVVPGMIYLYRLDLMDQGVDAVAPVVEVIWFDAAHVEIGRDDVASSTLSSGQMTGARGCVLTPDQAVIARFRLSIPIEPDGAGTIWFDNLGVFPSGTSSDVSVDHGDERRLDLSLGR